MSELPLAARPHDARLRLPREPYPGLRPFLDFEAALLFGRERQVREVIERLAETQFVAVLGGSGSGKSSLIHAGLVPELRSYGIPGAGDCWLPMSVTPGTNVSGADRAERRHTPVTRLALRFAGLLKSRGSEAADRARVDEIAEVFRQPAGFARLVDTYGPELAVPSGPRPEDARVLFVLDQFEELFHPTNQGVDDASLLVERVLDHFFAPHERCYVVLTMRSEHLNDCAGFLELPDAINKSSYLIRRLDADELRAAITGPAQRFLRLAARSSRSPTDTPLPEAVVFDEAVVERLLADVQAITHDPDHLPLLQHLLARLWAAALEREDLDTHVPSRITMDDLARAVAAGSGAVGASLAASVNTLRAAAEHWPETLYQWHDAPSRARLDALFRHLAFKDPNTGQYSQQRVDVDRCEAFLGPGMRRAELRALVAEGFLGGVDYLFWDDEDPSRVTLKVSHESFIRGWGRFRALVDAESAHFDEFVGVLRKTAEWDREGRGDDYLLETGEWRRLHDSGFLARFDEPGRREDWRRFLAIDRDGPRLAGHEPALAEFVAASRARLEQRERIVRSARASAIGLVAITVLFALLPTALFAIFVQGPTLRRAEQLFDAGNRANRAAFGPSQASVGANAASLDSLLRAAERVESARIGEGSWRIGASRRLLDRLGGLPPFDAQQRFLSAVFAQAEPPVNSQLRELLATSMWRAAPPVGIEPLIPPQLLRGQLCVNPGLTQVEADRRGQLFVAPRIEAAPAAASAAAAAAPRPLRALWVPEPGGPERPLQVFSAGVDPQSKLCTLGEELLSVPASQQSRVVFDATMRYFYYTLQGPTTPLPSVVVQEIDWERDAEGRLRALERERLATITDPEAVRAVAQVVGDEQAAVVPSWRLPDGRQVQVGGRQWRLVARMAVRVEPETEPEALEPAPAGSACASLAGSFAAMPGYTRSLYQTARHCVTVARGNPSFDAVGAALKPVREEVLLAVHERPAGAVVAHAGENPPAPVASFLPFARVPVDEVWDGGGVRFALGRGVHEGWLLMKLRGRAGNERWVGAPWSTCALWRIGRSLQDANALHGDGEAGVSRACELPLR